MRATGATTSAAAGMPIPLLALALGEPDWHQGRASVEAQNRIGGSRPAPGNAPRAICTATLDSTWGSRDRREGAPRVDGTTSYLLDGMSVIAQYAPDGARQAWYTQSLARIDEVLSVVNSQGKFWYQADALGSTYALTTDTGAVQARGGYDVFGEPVAVSGKAIGQPFGFTGREHELDSGLVYARARYLSTGTGRWSRADPIGLGDGPNLYGYVGARPTELTDPTGKWMFQIPAAYAAPALIVLGGLAGMVGDALGQAYSIALRMARCGTTPSIEDVAGQIDGIELEIATLLGAAQAVMLLYAPIATPFAAGLLGMTLNVVQFLAVAAFEHKINTSDVWGFWVPLAVSAALGFYAGYRTGPMPAPGWDGTLLWRQLLSPTKEQDMIMLAAKAAALRVSALARSVLFGAVANISPIQVCQ